MVKGLRACAGFDESFATIGIKLAATDVDCRDFPPRAETKKARQKRALPNFPSWRG